MPKPWRQREHAAIVAIEELINGGFEPHDPQSEGRWAEHNSEGRVIAVNLEGTNDVHVTDEWLTHFSAFMMLEGMQVDYNPTFTGTHQCLVAQIAPSDVKTAEAGTQADREQAGELNAS